MKIVYYTSSHFLDIVLENISLIKFHCEIYLIIEINPYSKCSTIIDLSNYKNSSFLENADEVLTNTNQTFLLPYFSNLSEAKFAFFSSNRSLSIKNYHEASLLKKYIKKINPNIIHFDTISSRAIPLLTLHKKCNIIITLHDAKPHPGEESWKEILTNYFFYKKTNQFVFHSEHVRKLFSLQYNKKEHIVLKMLPYTTYTKIEPDNKIKISEKYILFYGRISYYKGTDILIEAFKNITKEFPDWNLHIAGKEVYGYKLFNKYKDFPASIQCFNNYISPNDLSQLIKHASILVCPYREASQSGVLMTAKAFKKPVLATRIGSFEEYINDGLNGFLCEPSVESIENKLRDIIRYRKDLYVSRYLQEEITDESYEINLSKQMKLYGIGRKEIHDHDAGT